MIELFVIVLLLVFWLQWIAGRQRAGAPVPVPPQPIALDELPAMVPEVMDVAAAYEQGGVVVVRGTLRVPSAEGYRHLRQGLPATAVPHLGAGEEGDSLLLLGPHAGPAARPVRPWLHWLLLALTLATTTWAGARHQGLDLFREPSAIWRGLPYALGLMLLLGLFVWPGLLMWAVIVFFLAGRGMPPGDDLTPLGAGRWALGLFTFAVLASLLLPLPHALWQAVGLHCPYL